MFTIIIIITAILLVGYCLLIGVYRHWFLLLPEYGLRENAGAGTRFSVIIPARDEEHNIAACLQSIIQQKYPAELFEVIVINDHSTDGTEQVVRSFSERHSNIHLINLHEYTGDSELNAYKKKAIELAISQSRNEWIVTTDADCVVKPGWLLTLSQFIAEKNPVFVAAPVMFRDADTFLSTFQLLDFISLQGITAAAVSAGYHTMCNGANLAYRKDVFMEVGQFKGIDAIASGDDMLLMHKIKMAYPERVTYLFAKESIVETEPVFNWKDFINQRIRWASKADKYNDKRIFWILALVYAVNAGLFILLVSSFFTTDVRSVLLLLIVVKTIVELGFMIPVARFYDQRLTLIWFPIMQPIHITYTVIAGWLGKFGTYRWKGRKVK